MHDLCSSKKDVVILYLMSVRFYRIRVIEIGMRFIVHLLKEIEVCV